MKKPIVLAILDGFGISHHKKGNAILNAKTPFFDNLKENYPYTELNASGEFVGLPKGQIGNSEVGHLNIGAGRVVYTGLSLINKEIETGEFFKNLNLIKSINHAKENNSTLHLIGLLSPGGVHSEEEHLFKILDLAHKKGLKSVSIHVLGDGRDVSPKSIKKSLGKLELLNKKYGYKIASIQGRVYGMDRDSNFDKIEKGLEAILGKASNTFSDPIDYIEKEYNKQNFDEFLTPAINEEKDVKFLEDNDSVILFNFRPDRMRQLAHKLVGSKIYSEKKLDIKNLQVTSMMKYEGIDCDVAFDSMKVPMPFGEVISKSGYNQLRLAETQKYAHVTYFFDGGIEIKYPKMDTIMVDSIKIDNYAKAPKMCAETITDKFIENANNYDFIIMNYANADMVGHTGDYGATIKAIECLDYELSRLEEKVQELGGVLFITADHGNAEIMINEEGKVVTKHSTSKVPLYSSDKKLKFIEGGSLGNVAPTILKYSNIEIPKEIDLKPLI